MKTVLSLFDYSGNWSRPYREAGYNVIQIDLKLGIDILTVNPSEFSNVEVILIAVPCDDFAASGARWWKDKDQDGRTAHSMALVWKSLEFVAFHKPPIWALENPVGRIGRLCQLGKPTFVFNPCDFGEDYTKKTCLWGQFIPPLPLFIGGDKSTAPTAGSKMWKLPPSPNRKELRSVTPSSFAYAFYQANPGSLAKTNAA